MYAYIMIAAMIKLKIIFLVHSSRNANGWWKQKYLDGWWESISRINLLPKLKSQ